MKDTKILLEDIRMGRPIPARDKDYKSFDDLFSELVAIYGSAKKVPGVYVSDRSNVRPLTFMLDTTEDIPEEAQEVLGKYKPVLEDEE